MRSITLSNYRCFGDEKQTARLAPLTLLVGENSSGKTSLMAMARAMWDVAHDERVPDFKEEPYDLGSFDEIAHHRGARGSRAASFMASVELDASRRPAAESGLGHPRFEAEFAEQWSAPVPVRRRLHVPEKRKKLRLSGFWFEHRAPDGEPEVLEIGTPSGRWVCVRGDSSFRGAALTSSERLESLWSLMRRFRHALDDERHGTWDIQRVRNSPALTEGDLAVLEATLIPIPRIGRPLGRRTRQRPFASAPVRSQPKRTYDPVRISGDPVGNDIPTYLAQLEMRAPDEWQRLKASLEEFGHTAGLFDELKIRRRGQRESDPFQVQVRKFGDGAKGPFRNLADVGYGVSQVLPVATELLRSDGPGTVLLQQPEVHLHPVAQASLGSLLCERAAARSKSSRKQIIVETHSDFIIDRVRMAVRDERSGLSPKDISIVFFERGGLDVRLHSISVDRLGNVEGAPAGYRQFFLDELQRSLGG